MVRDAMTLVWRLCNMCLKDNDSKLWTWYNNIYLFCCWDHACYSIWIHLWTHWNENNHCSNYLPWTCDISSYSISSDQMLRSWTMLWIITEINFHKLDDEDIYTLIFQFVLLDFALEKCYASKPYLYVRCFVCLVTLWFTSVPLNGVLFNNNFCHGRKLPDVHVNISLPYTTLKNLKKLSSLCNLFKLELCHFTHFRRYEIVSNLNLLWVYFKHQLLKPIHIS